MSAWIYRRDEVSLPMAVGRRFTEFELETFDLVRAPARFWGDGSQAPPLVEAGLDAHRIRPVQSPAEVLQRLPEGETWRGTTRRSLARLLSWFLLCEDPQRRLDAQTVVTLAHQASLVQHVLNEPNLRRVLIADEVGLGKTVEAGLLLQQLLTRQPGLRIIYFAPARLVSNVRREFDRLDLGFRSWAAGRGGDASLDDRRIIASIHRASHPAHFEAVKAAPPWDVIVVDECHHYSDWAKGGGSPARKLRLVQELAQRLRPGGRVILLSGTPHQGSAARFENLLRLLREEGESDDAVSGRVIYRIKDDVQDWDGRPLFPRRQVNPPVVMETQAPLRAWLESIHDLFGSAPKVSGGTSEARRRASGWRASMALQWATSSVQAGLGYMVRQAIRAQWRLEDEPLREALAVLRPYRGGSPDEPLTALYARMAREVDQQDRDGDIDDIEDPLDGEAEPGTWRPERARLADVLRDGVELYRRAPDAKWDFIADRLLRHMGDEKVVLFAQPIETVTALASYLERTTGSRPALVVGGQDERERQQEIESFWRPDGPRFLVSSRAGGEGINLQIARRLIHVDVPWNPMELEQRIGRVHRFKSRRTVIIDTVVVKDSREVDAYRIARDKLGEFASTMVPEDRMEALFGRVMSLVPPDELQDILNDRPTSPFTESESSRLQTLVKRGFESWRSFDTRFKTQQQQIRNLDPGQSTWADLERFARDHLAAQTVDGFTALRFRYQDGEVIDASETATTLAIGGRTFACGEYGGMPVTQGGATAEQLGLNVKEVAEALRTLGLGESSTGAAHVRWPDRVPLPVENLGRVFGVLVFARQTIRFETETWVENALALHLYVIKGAGETIPVNGADRARVVRTLLDATARIDPEDAPGLAAALVVEETRILSQLRVPSEVERTHQVRHAITPVFAAIVAVGKSGGEEPARG